MQERKLQVDSGSFLVGDLNEEIVEPFKNLTMPALIDPHHDQKPARLDWTDVSRRTLAVFNPSGCRYNLCIWNNICAISAL